MSKLITTLASISLAAIVLATIITNAFEFKVEVNHYEGVTSTHYLVGGVSVHNVLSAGE